MNKKISIKRIIKEYAVKSIKLLMIFFLLMNSLQYFVFAALTTVTAIPTYSNTATPSYTFNSDSEVGAITY